MKFYKINKQKENEQWHIWFAWFPIKVKTMDDGDFKYVWLENVLRCGEWHHVRHDSYFEYHHKEIKRK